MENAMVQTIFETRPSKSEQDDAFRSDRGHPGTWNELGNNLVKVGAYEDAINAYKTAIDVDPAYGLSYSNLAALCIFQGKLAEAVSLCKKSIRILSDKKEKAITWARLGEAYRQQGQYEQAMNAYQEADKLNEARITQQSDFRLVEPHQIYPKSKPGCSRGNMDELLASIQTHGIIQPLIVCPRQEEPGTYLLIAGARRLEAAKKLGLSEVPVIVRQAGAREILELSINENSHRVQTNLMEEAESYRLLAKDFELSLDEVCARVAKSHDYVTNALSLLELPDDLRQAIALDQINQEQANALVQLPTPQSRGYALQYILKNDLNTGQTEDLIFRLTNTKPNDAGRIFGDSSTFAPEGEEKTDFTPNPPEPENRPGKTSLFNRARFLLKSNPQVERHSATLSYRA
jgi:ParB family chromosome partitioning protein